MVHGMKVNIQKVKNMDKELTYGVMVQNMLASGLIIK